MVVNLIRFTEFESHFKADTPVLHFWLTSAELSLEYGAAAELGLEYGAPAAVGLEYGAPAELGLEYGASTELGLEYGECTRDPPLFFLVIWRSALKPHAITWTLVGIIRSRWRAWSVAAIDTETTLILCYRLVPGRICIM